MLNRLMGMPPNASEHGFMIDHMLEVVHWFMAFLFVGWSIFFFVTLFKFHRSRNPRADYHGVRTKASSHIEFMVVLVEAVLLIGFAVPLWAKRVTQFPTDDALPVRVVAQQFLWNFHYAGADGVFGKQDASFISSTNQLGLDKNDPAAADDIVTLNELRLPQNRSVIAEITSKDVIHSFSLQHMRIGQDATPGTMIPIWFKPVRTGEFEIICGQLCGLSHYNMRALMAVDTPEEFENWYKSAPTFNPAGVHAPAPSTGAGAPAPPPPTTGSPGETGVKSPTVPQPSEGTTHPVLQPQPKEALPGTSPAGSEREPAHK